MKTKKVIWGEGGVSEKSSQKANTKEDQRNEKGESATIEDMNVVVFGTSQSGGEKRK